MQIEDIPDLKDKFRYPARITVTLTSDSKEKLDYLKRFKRKDTAKLVRMLIENFLENIEVTDELDTSA